MHLLKKFALKTGKNADSVEWCPIEGYQSFLACGTYELTQITPDERSGSAQQAASSGERFGQIYLFQLCADPEILKQCQCIETEGILDCKWSPTKIVGGVYLAAVDAKGYMQIYCLHQGKAEFQLKCKKHIGLDSSTLLLSLDWSNRIDQNSLDIVASDSAGFIHVVSFSSDGLITKSSSKLHDHEAWICAFNYWNTNILYTGGDDSKLRCFDQRTNTAVMTSREHSAGVTSIQSNFKKMNIFISGSYDERILLWDERQMRSTLKEVSAPGGVWRVKWRPRSCDLVAACCMYGGSCIVDDQLNFKTDYKFHESINYGIDWCYLKCDEVQQVTGWKDQSSSYAVGGALYAYAAQVPCI